MENMEKEIILQSIITCPNCGHSKEETMPTDSCQFFYECENCHTVLKPESGEVKLTQTFPTGNSTEEPTLGSGVYQTTLSLVNGYVTNKVRCLRGSGL